MFGFGDGPTPGEAAAQKLCEGFAGLSADEKELVAELLVRLAPSLAAQGGQAQALPMGKILAVLRAVLSEAWLGIMRPKILFAELGRFLDTSPEAAELRAFCKATADRCTAAAAKQPPALGAVP